MKKSLLVLALGLASFNTFAAGLNFTQLTCTIKSQAITQMEESFKMVIELSEEASAVNNTGLIKTITGDVVITFGINTTKTLRIRNLSIGQETSAYGYELHTGARLFGSQYPTNLSLQPQIKKGFLADPKLISYNGAIELNAVVDGSDRMVMKTDNVSKLVCVPN